MKCATRLTWFKDVANEHSIHEKKNEINKTQLKVLRKKLLKIVKYDKT